MSKSIKATQASKEQILDYLEKNDITCNYCPASEWCRREVVATPNGPLFPRCWEDDSFLLNEVTDIAVDYLQDEGVKEIEVEE